MRKQAMNKVIGQVLILSLVCCISTGKNTGVRSLTEIEAAEILHGIVNIDSTVFNHAEYFDGSIAISQGVKVQLKPECIANIDNYLKIFTVNVPLGMANRMVYILDKIEVHHNDDMTVGNTDNPYIIWFYYSDHNEPDVHHYIKAYNVKKTANGYMLAEDISDKVRIIR